jgi:hypothetical protein
LRPIWLESVGAERFNEGLLRETCGCWRWCGHGFFGASAEAEDRGSEAENNEIFHWMRWFLSKPKGRFLRDNGAKEGRRKVFLRGWGGKIWGGGLV